MVFCSHDVLFQAYRKLFWEPNATSDKNYCMKFAMFSTFFPPISSLPFFRNKVWLPCLKTRLLMSQFPSVQSSPGDFRIFGWKNRNREFYWWLYKMASSANRSSDVIIIDGSIMEGVRRTYLWVIPFTKTVPIKLSFWDKFFVSTCFRSCGQFIDFEFTFIVLYFTAIKSVLTISRVVKSSGMQWALPAC